MRKSKGSVKQWEINDISMRTTSPKERWKYPKLWVQPLKWYWSQKSKPDEDKSFKPYGISHEEE